MGPRSCKSHRDYIDVYLYLTEHYRLTSQNTRGTEHTAAREKGKQASKRKCNPSSCLICTAAGVCSSSSTASGVLAGNLLGWKGSKLKAEPSGHYLI